MEGEEVNVMLKRTAGLQARIVIHERAWRPAVRKT
jgi:hypothetical protein